MAVDPGPLESLRRLLNDTADLAVVTLLMLAGVIFFLPGIQKRWTYAGAAFAIGLLLGIAARRFGLPDGLDIIAVMVGVIAGPVTVAKLHGKTIFEVVDEIRKARSGDTEGS